MNSLFKKKILKRYKVQGLLNTVGEGINCLAV